MMDNALAKLNLTAAQYAVLSLLEAEPGQSNALLARSAFVTPQTMQQILANLERDKLLARRPDRQNPSILRARLTATGRRVIALAHAAVSPIEKQLLVSFAGIDPRLLVDRLSRCAEDLAPRNEPED